MGKFKIHKQGVGPNGGSWAEYTDSFGRKCRIAVRQGLDLEEEIRKCEKEDARYRAEWAKLSPEDQERRIREWNETMASFDEKDGGGTSYAMAHSTAPSALSPDG